MIAKQILFLSGFVEGETTSMALYADGLSWALKNYLPTEIISQEFTPKMLLPSWFQNAWGLRFARYILYPLLAPHPEGMIIHLLDHGYTHFLYTYKPAKTIVTVTDLIPLLWWKGQFPWEPKRRLPVTILYTLYALKRAKHIIAISSNTKNDLVNYLGCNPAKISVIYPGVDPIFRQYDPLEKQAARIRLFGPACRKIVLITGSQFYKNHETALETISFLYRSGVENICLVKTGSPNRGWNDLVRKYGLEDNVLNIGFIPREEMPDLYNAVDVLLFPSIYEGFGWPPLEAMACGTPVLTSNSASLPEVMGPASESMCSPFDYIGFAQKIQALLTDENYRQESIDRGLVQAAKFNWKDTANQVNNVYDLVNREI